MKALVTGGAGFIGSHLVDLLISKDLKVVVVDNFSTGRKSNLDHLADNDQLEIVELDISTDPRLNELATDADYIFHIAALADIVPSVQNPELYYQSNVTGTLKVLQAARLSKNLKKFVYAASSSCYGIPDNYPTNEEAEIRVEYPYALTKRMGEEMVLHWGKLYDLPVITTRFFNVYGPRSRTSGTYGAVFGTFLAQKLAGSPYTVVGDGKQTRDFIFVKDLVSALYKLAGSEIKDEAFNIGSGTPNSVNRLVELLGGEITYIPKRPGEPDCTHANIEKVLAAVDWKPKTSFEQGVQIMLDNIDYWSKAPVWTPETIEKETKPWFEALGK
ncbi:MAG: NAD-dependent epimerase/dehydratase family protein [Bacteriovoracaceae bacterium]|jgi:UDP-glucose 4-epimerase|nr:NAD-dependent epimerase/dehydratase family protein [Bacteriovoracaceae bacterium]